MKQFILCLILGISGQIYAQRVFKQGSILKENGNRLEVLIQNNDGLTNPTEVQFKTSPDAPLQQLSINEIREFEIYNSRHKYIKYVGKLDKSSIRTSMLSISREPKYVTDTLLLKVLIEGDQSLYSFTGGEIPLKMFYSANGPIEPLVYKKYLVGNTNIRTNNMYLQQLNNAIKCESITPNDIKNSSYKEKSLSKLFRKWNECTGSGFEDYIAKREKGTFNISLFGGISKSSFIIEQSYPRDKTTEVQSSIAPLLGVELEYIVPFFNRKLSFVLQPSVELVKAQDDVILASDVDAPSNPGGPGLAAGNLEVNYTLLKLPAKLRYYAFTLRKNSKIYIQGGAAVGYILNNKNAYSTTGFPEYFPDLSTFSEEAFVSFNAGAGMRFNKNFLVDLTYSPNIDLTSESSLDFKFKNHLSLTFGYTF